MRVKATAAEGAPATDIWLMKHSGKLSAPADLSHAAWALVTKSVGACQTIDTPILAGAVAMLPLCDGVVSWACNTSPLMQTVSQHSADRFTELFSSHSRFLQYRNAIDPHTANQFFEVQPARKSRTSSPFCHNMGAGRRWVSAIAALISSTSIFDQLTDDVRISPVESTKKSVGTLVSP